MAGIKRELAFVEVGNLRMYCRPVGGDRETVEVVLNRNHYRFPDDLRGKTVLDIGAHIGSASILCASRGARVIAYEPTSENAMLLRLNVYINDFEAAITVHQKAVGNLDLTCIHLHPTNYGSHSTFRDLEGFSDGLEEVRSVTLQDAFEENGIDRCDLLKMDCEGGEIEIIPQILELHDRIDAIVAEIHSGARPPDRPDLGAMISAAARTLDQHYTREVISSYEFLWTHR